MLGKPDRETVAAFGGTVVEAEAGVVGWGSRIACKRLKAREAGVQDSCCDCSHGKQETVKKKIFYRHCSGKVAASKDKVESWVVEGDIGGNLRVAAQAGAVRDQR